MVIKEIFHFIKVFHFIQEVLHFIKIFYLRPCIRKHFAKKDRRSYRKSWSNQTTASLPQQDD